MNFLFAIFHRTLRGGKFLLSTYAKTTAASHVKQSGTTNISLVELSRVAVNVLKTIALCIALFLFLFLCFRSMWIIGCYLFEVVRPFIFDALNSVLMSKQAVEYSSTLLTILFSFFTSAYLVLLVLDGLNWLVKAYKTGKTLENNSGVI